MYWNRYTGDNTFDSEFERSESKLENENASDYSTDFIGNLIIHMNRYAKYLVEIVLKLSSVLYTLMIVLKIKRMTSTDPADTATLWQPCDKVVVDVVTTL